MLLTQPREPLPMTATLHMPRRSATGVALSIAFATAPAWADGPPQRGQGSQWGVGLAAIGQTSPYRGVGSDTKVLPALMFENSHVRLLGPMLDLKLPPAGPVSFALTLRYSDDGYKASDAAELQGMAERKDGFWLGAKARWNTPWIALSAGILGDASNHSGGQQLRLETSRGFGLGSRTRLEPRLALTWLDRAYVEHFYGVNAGEASTGRAAYTGPSTVNTELGLRLNTQLAPGHGVMMDFKHTLLGSGIKNSPLVDRNGVSGVFVAYLHQF